MFYVVVHSPINCPPPLHIRFYTHFSNKLSFIWICAKMFVLERHLRTGCKSGCVFPLMTWSLLLIRSSTRAECEVAVQQLQKAISIWSTNNYSEKEDLRHLWIELLISEGRSPPYHHCNRTAVRFIIRHLSLWRLPLRWNRLSNRKISLATAFPINRPFHLW